MTQPETNDVNAIRDNVFDLVAASRRALQQGMVDISPVEHSVRAYCEAVAGLSKDEARQHSADLTRLTSEITELEKDLKDAYEQVQRKLTELGQHQKAHTAYKKSTGPSAYKPANDD